MRSIANSLIYIYSLLYFENLMYELNAISLILTKIVFLYSINYYNLIYSIIIPNFDYVNYVLF